MNNKTTYVNRYKDEITFEHIGDEVIMRGGKWLRYSKSNEDNSITMIDPSGGPYIEVGNNLKGFWLKGKYQDLIVKEIKFSTEQQDCDDCESIIIFKIK